MNRIYVWYIWPVLGGAISFLVLYLWRGFFAQHSLIIGIGVAALIYTGIRTVANLRVLYRSRNR